MPSSPRNTADSDDVIVGDLSEAAIRGGITMSTAEKQDQPGAIPELDDLSEDELGMMLAEAERALRDIRT